MYATAVGNLVPELLVVALVVGNLVPELLDIDAVGNSAPDRMSAWRYFSET